MGSFNATCIVSNLPIERGTPVRFVALTKNRYHEGNEHVCYVGGRWQLRCPPIRAQYNDYGSIEDIEDPRLAHTVFFESLNRDAVEKGVGDNQCHDVHVRAGMTRDEWLEALWEGRVEVGQPRNDPHDPLDSILGDFEKDTPRPVYEPTAGIPTLTRIETILRVRGQPVVTTYGADGYVIDEVAHGFVRIRCGGHEKREAKLESLLPILTPQYAAMVTVGSGNYANQAEILVAAKPNPNVHIGSGLTPETNYHKPRAVSQAMIREDVWQIMLKMPVQTWSGSIQFPTMLSDAKKTLYEELETRAYDASDDPIVRLQRRLVGLERTNEGSKNVFRAAIQPYEGVSGFSLKQALELGLDLSDDPNLLDGFALDLAEAAYVEWVYARLHGQWQPTTNSGQEGNWKARRHFMRALTKIRGRYEDD